MLKGTQKKITCLVIASIMLFGAVFSYTATYAKFFEEEKYLLNDEVITFEYDELYYTASAQECSEIYGDISEDVCENVCEKPYYDMYENVYENLYKDASLEYPITEKKEIQEIMPFTTHCCITSNVHASGTFGNITAANSPTGAMILGARWEFCNVCNTITIFGGDINGSFSDRAIQMPDNTNTLSQSAFPAAIRPLVEHVVITGPITAGTSLQCLFHGLTNLTTINGLEYIDTTITRNFRRAFMETSSLTGPIDLSVWNTSSATNFYRLFNHSGIDVLNLGGNFNTGGLVTNFGSMFWGASNLTAIGDISNWNTTGAPGQVRMSRMFQDANSLVALDVSNWDTSNVTLMYNMFHGASSLTNLDLLGWDVSNVLRMDNMFAGVSSMTHLDLSTWETLNLQRMDNMFDNNNPNLISLNLENFITDGVVNRNNMLNSRNLPISLREITFGPGWYWNAFNIVGLGNPPNNEIYTGLWIRVGTGTVNNPAGPETATSAELFNNMHFPNAIADTWVWQTRHPRFTVTFDLDGGEYSGDQILLQQIVVYGENAAELTTEPTNAEYNFIGWTPTLNLTNVTYDRTFVAKWQRESDGNSSGNSNGNRGGNNSVIITSPDIPYTFVGDHIWYVRGFPDGNFRPNWEITRAEMSMILFRLLDSANKYTPVSNNFSDVNTGWYAQAVSYLASLGIVTGYPDGTFRPNAPITRAELTAVMSRFFELNENGTHNFSDISGSHWAIRYINNAVNRGWVIGFEDGSFRPENPTTRAEAVTLINRVLGRIPNPGTIQNTLYPFLYENFGMERLFYDLTNSHWAYYQIMEAATDHEFVRDDENREIWEAVYIPWLTQ